MPTAPTIRLLTGGTAPDDVAALRTALAERLAQRGLLGPGDGRPAASPLPLLVPIGPSEDADQVRADLARRITRVPPRTDLILRTSGSTTGTGRLIAISAAALAASARATHDRLGGPGTWLLPLPAHHVAGLQILIRSLMAATAPVVVDTSTGFSPTALADALRSARPVHGPSTARLYTSLVPTQLVRVLRDPAASSALAQADAVLLGGAAADPALLARARGAGITVVTTYGMSETGGGCVYDGRPLDGVEISIQDPDADGSGRILISGPVLAEGYLHSPELTHDDAGEGFADSAGARVLTTSDRGRLRPDGRLEVLGRLDDVIITGGIKVEPRYVEEALTGLEAVAEACVVGLPDEQWGSVVTAAVVLEPAAGREGAGAPDGAALREAARARLDGARAPKRVVILEGLPLRPSGKVDRRAVARILAEAAATATPPAAESPGPSAPSSTPGP
ncbi:O-succinylbenzoic acid--CoA ligase [Actinomyces viscosus]|uniref:2-succinylbenzoate--CoA ligase n=2 Tax=Actinomyces viscosus TaxID=1656 RepID=A0A448PLB5_ACTVI|nr:AMP-binding protein [Actinomyces viscosus]TFH52550.1 O-succinylbenzoic acid--CoA ligase [Actinomyces viscosus]VEI16372.1 2-succinylbenzoate--CoA ligase [Actinomyces viscosus]